MDSKSRSSHKWLTGVISRPGFWLIVITLILITLPHYVETLGHPAFVARLVTNFGLTRHSFERILYLAPIVWAGFLFGWVGTIATSVIALALMLPQAIFFSDSSLDAILETIAVFVIGSVLAVSFNSLRKERDQRRQLESATKELRSSKEEYQGLFENALDAIVLHDLDGNITAANQATEKLTGYSIEELTRMNVRSLLTEESLVLAREIKQKLLTNTPAEQPYEQRMVRKDKTEADVQLVTNMVVSGGKPMAFQHMVRDITIQKQMQENSRFYLQRTIWAQEDERKRISRELHDDTIQALVVLSRNLDSFVSDNSDLSEEQRRRLELLRQETNGIVQGVRRLSQDLRPAALDRLGLMSALEWLASDVASYSGVAIKVNVLGTGRRLSEETELVLFRIVQEALRNIWRHSKAKQAEVRVEFEAEKIKITITDNGAGFSPPARMGDLAKNGKLGLTGMEERARLINGILTVQSQIGIGTTVTIEIPV